MGTQHGEIHQLEDDCASRKPNDTIGLGKPPKYGHVDESGGRSIHEMNAEPVHEMSATPEATWPKDTKYVKQSGL